MSATNTTAMDIPPPLQRHSATHVFSHLDTKTADWKEKLTALEEKFAKDLADKEEMWEQQMRLLQLEIHNKDNTIQSLTQTKDNLLQSLDRKTAEHNQIEAAWKKEVRDLKEKSVKEVSQLQITIRNKDDEILMLTAMKNLLQDSLAEKTSHLLRKSVELNEAKAAWTEKFTALEEKFAKDLADHDKMWEEEVSHLQLDIHNKDNTIQHLTQRPGPESQ